MKTITSEQRIIITLLSSGLSVKQIAFELNISESTIRTQIYRAMQKFECHNRIELLNIIKEMGLI